MRLRLADRGRVLVYGAWSVRLLLCLALLYVATLEAWLVDDAKITFRQVWNFIHGDGITYNFGERVQAFTHPAWFLLLSGAGIVTRELFITTTILSIALSVGAVALLLAAESRIRGGGGGRVPLLTPALLLIFSVAFCDYMTSGLENPLSYFLVGVLLWLVAADGEGGPRRWLFLVLALLALNRLDFAALFLPLAMALAVIAHKAHGLRGLLREVWPGALLLGSWLAFALLYFGSPLPNTYYAKMATDEPLDRLLESATDYFIQTARQDPISLTAVVVGILASLASGSRMLLALVAGQVLYAGYIVSAGGDWMPSGRFFSVPVFLAVGQLTLALADGGTLATTRRWLVAGMLSLALVFGALPGRHYPVAAATGHFTGQVRTAHATERLRWGLLSMPRSRIVAMPQRQPTTLASGCWAGQPHLRQPDFWRLDSCALTDPFLARLPKERFAPGHYRHKFPTNYGLYVKGRVATLPDENLRGLLQDVALAARAPKLFTGERLKALWRLNTGHYGSLDLSRYADPAIRIPWMDTTGLIFTVPLAELSGPAKPDDHPWQAVGIHPRWWNRVQVELDTPRPSAALQLSLSHMEDYEIHVNGELIAIIDRVGPDGLLKNHTVHLPRPMQVESIEIRALGRYKHRAFSIGHLHIR